MKKALLSVAILFCYHQQLVAQDYLWAFTAAKAHHTQSVAIRKDNQQNIYLATYTDSASKPVYTELEKRTAARQLLWHKQINGTAAIADVEINAANHAVVTGYFLGTISIDSTVLTNTSTTNNSGFIFEASEDGTVLWAHTINPINNRFTPVDLFIAANGVMYLTAGTAGTGGYCAFLKLDAAGNVLKSEFTTTFDNETFSHIIADSLGNVYVSGTCGNLATFDALSANPNYSYQNVLLKYDSNFTAQWIMTKNYSTFDHNNKLCTDGKNLYWVFDEYVSNSDTVKIIKTSYSGQVLSAISAPYPQAFLPPVDFSVDRFGNSVLFQQFGVMMYLTRYDSLFNIVWQDTLASGTSGFPLRNSLICYDSCFYMMGIYVKPTLALNSITLTNPNTGISYPSDIFVCKWGYQQLLPLSVLGFSAAQKEEYILLKWHTENDANINKFILEKSTDGIHFHALATAIAEHTAQSNYQYADAEDNGQNEILYYRLKQVNKDAGFIYSKVLSVKLNHAIHAVLFPNPATDAFTLRVRTANARQTIQVMVYNIKGQLISTLKAPASQSIFHFGESYPAGVYIIHATQGNNKAVVTGVKKK